ncbi:MAG: AAA family ATPase [Patescibacteria group bacterium]
MKNEKNIEKINRNNTKFNWPLVGNEHIINYLSRSVLNKKVTDSYIFLGPEDLGKTTVASELAKILLCNSYIKYVNNNEITEVLPCGQCPSCLQFNKKIKPLNLISSETNTGEGSEIAHGDFHILKREKDKKNISIEQIRNFIRALSLSSFLGFYKIGIIKGADYLSQEAANALLKTLEEPNDKVVIILIATNLEVLPKTIISRSQVLNFYPVKADLIYDYLIKEYKISRSLAKNLSRLSLGRPALAIKFLEDKDFYNNYFDRVKAFTNFFNQDINERIKELEKIIGVRSSGQESAKLAIRIIDTWQGLIRDLILLKQGEVNLVQHQVILEDLRNLKDRVRLDKLITMINNLALSKEYIKANVSSKLVFENFIVNI